MSVDKACNSTFNQIACCDADLKACNEKYGVAGALKCEAEYVRCKGKPRT